MQSFVWSSSSTKRFFNFTTGCLRRFRFSTNEADLKKWKHFSQQACFSCIDCCIEENLPFSCRKSWCRTERKKLKVLSDAKVSMQRKNKNFQCIFWFWVKIDLHDRDGTIWLSYTKMKGVWILRKNWFCLHLLVVLAKQGFNEKIKKKQFSKMPP